MVIDPPSTQVTQKTSGNPTEGGSLTLTCDITDGRPRDDIKRVTWKKGGQEVTSSGRNNLSDRDLTISSLDHSKDDGSYTCAAKNAAGMGGSGDAFQLDVLYRPLGKATTDPTSVTVAVGEHVSLTCRAPTESGNPPASWFYWSKQNSDFSKNTTLLNLTNSRVDESGKFSCVAGNWIGQSNSSDWATVAVQAPAKVEYPRIDNIPWTPGFDDTDFSMTCTVSGSGDVKVVWLKDGVSVDTDDFAVTTVKVTDRHYIYGQTAAKNSTLEWKVTERARYFTCGNITHFDGNYTCAVTTETAGAMTHDVSKAFVVNVQYEAHWAHSATGPPVVAAAVEDVAVDIVCPVCANPQPHLIWTFSNESLREGITVTGDRITLDVVRTDDVGFYECTASNNVNGENRSVTFPIELVASGPSEKPERFVVLSNHTSAALTLRWRPGFDGGYSPQVFTLQYGKSDKSLRTWKELFTYETDGMTWYQSTVTGLQSQTLYVFSLYAENNRPGDKGPNRSPIVTQTGSTTTAPQVKIASVTVKEDHMTVKWTYNGNTLRRRRSTSTNVSVVIHYQKHGGAENHYPPEGTLAAEEKQVTIGGHFDSEAKYKIWLTVYEGLLAISFLQTQPVEATIEKDDSKDSSPEKTTAVTVSVLFGGILIGVVIGLVSGCIIWRRRRTQAVQKG
ncbi:hypothetical protein LSAT2_012662 [Lamellibrachia satsuma]|nr:hypothetical protein LSAT2_012662 [Lamellibrachia satsuma]